MTSISRTFLSAIPYPFKRVLVGSDPLITAPAERFTPIRIDKLKVTTKLKNSILSNRSFGSDYHIERNKKLAVVIPYRNRAKHLEKFIPALTEKLIKEGIEFRIIVAEHADQRLFNRAKSKARKEVTKHAFFAADMAESSLKCRIRMPFGTHTISKLMG